LNTIWEAKPESNLGIWGILRKRVFSIGMVFSVGFLRLISLLVSTALTALTTFLRQMIPLPPLLMTGIDFLISFVAIAVLFGLILKYVPEATIDWKEVRIGALFTALLFTLGKSLLGLYLGRATPGIAFGAAGSLVVMVIWIYYSAQIFFFGAEFTRVYALAHAE